MKNNYDVIGSGLLAKEFKKINIPNTLVFASGVSDSNETSKDAFDRETNMLINAINKSNEQQIIYFSSFVSLGGGTLYSNHKREIESLILKTAKCFLIIRFPQIVGITKNNTLINFFIKNLMDGSQITLKEKAYRRLIAIEDCVRITRELALLDEVNNESINVAPNRLISIIDIYKYIEKISGLKGDILLSKIEDKRQDASLKRFIELSEDDEKVLRKNYQFEVLKKYIPLIMENYK